MPLLNVKTRFVPLVESSEKRQTIRPPRIDGRDPKAGDILHFFHGLRTKQCRRLGRAVCTGSCGVVIRADSYCLDACGPVTNARLLDHFAKADGFECWRDMTPFFLAGGRKRFFGILIEWDVFEAVALEAGQ